jgi:hypothetical protein
MMSVGMLIFLMSVLLGFFGFIVALPRTVVWIDSFPVEVQVFLSLMGLGLLILPFLIVCVRRLSQCRDR